jgi:hypothetical protein
MTGEANRLAVDPFADQTTLKAGLFARRGRDGRPISIGVWIERKINIQHPSESVGSTDLLRAVDSARALPLPWFRTTLGSDSGDRAVRGDATWLT